jgi:hypothetical protein
LTLIRMHMRQYSTSSEISTLVCEIDNKDMLTSSLTYIS